MAVEKEKALKVRDPRQARHDHAQGRPARAPHPRRALLNGQPTDGRRGAPSGRLDSIDNNNITGVSQHHLA